MAENEEEITAEEILLDIQKGKTPKSNKSYSLAEKISILDKAKEWMAIQPGIKKVELAKKINVPRPTLINFMKQETALRKESVRLNDMNKRKRKRTGKDPELEEELRKWYEITKTKNNSLEITGPMLRNVAKELAEKLGKKDFKITEGWFNRWKKRSNIILPKARRESTKKSSSTSSNNNFINNTATEILISEPQVTVSVTEEPDNFPPVTEMMRNLLHVEQYFLRHGYFNQAHDTIKLFNNLKSIRDSMIYPNHHHHQQGNNFL